MVDALLMSCIPVIISDHTMLPLSSIIDWSSLVIHISEADAIIPHIMASRLLSYNYTAIQAWKKRLRHTRITLPLSPPPNIPTSTTISLIDALSYPMPTASGVSSLSTSHSVVDLIISQLAAKVHVLPSQSGSLH
jgi:hypothetical protein